MNNFIFENGTKVIFGKGCVKEYLSCFLSHYGDNIMLAYGGGSIKRNGIYDEIMVILKSSGKNIVEFDGIIANPTYAKILEGAKLARENQVDVILAIGGGSVIDCCKAVSMAARYNGDIWNDFWVRPGIIDFEPVPLCTIVTAGGTGSEMNGSAVITNEELKIKIGRDYPKCNAKLVLVDPVYTYTVSTKQMVFRGFDTLSHIMETYFSDPHEPNVSDDIAEALMRGVIRDLRAAVKNPKDYNARSNLMWEAAMAGNCIIKLGKKTNSQCRIMEHQLGAFTDCNHEEGLAVLQPIYYRYIYKNSLEKFKQFAIEVWRISSDGKTDEELAMAGIEALEQFISEIGLPSALRELGVDEKLNLKAVADSCACVESI